MTRMTEECGAELAVIWTGSQVPGFGSAAAAAVAGKPILAHALDFSEYRGAQRALVLIDPEDPANEVLRQRPVDAAMETTAIASIDDMIDEIGNYPAISIRGDDPFAVVRPVSSLDMFELRDRHETRAVSPEALLAANIAALRGALPLAHRPGWDVAQDVRLEWAPGVPPRALRGPVHIGEGTWVSGSAMLSDCVIGAGSVIAPRARVRSAIVTAGTTVSADTTIDHAIVGPDFRIDVDADAVTEILGARGRA